MYIVLTYREYKDKASSLQQIRGQERDRKKKLKNIYSSYNGPNNCSTFTSRIRLAHCLLL